jgi:hypothetical protein
MKNAKPNASYYCVLSEQIRVFKTSFCIGHNFVDVMATLKVNYVTKPYK